MFWSPTRLILSAIRESREQILTRLAALEKKVMSGVDDLKLAIADVAQTQADESASIEAEFTAIESAIAKLQQGGGLSDADAAAMAAQLQTAVGNMKAAKANIDTETAKLQAI